MDDIDIDKLTALLTILKDADVSQFKHKDLYIEFAGEYEPEGGTVDAVGFHAPDRDDDDELESDVSKNPPKVPKTGYHKLFGSNLPKFKPADDTRG